MKGVVLAGGTGSRLYPLTKVTNKHLLPIYNKPMIYYPLFTLKQAGIKDVLIVSGKGHAGSFLELLGSGAEMGMNFAYEVQDNARGIADAVYLAKDFVDGEKFVVILGDNIIEDNISKAIKDFEKQKSGAKIFLKSVKNPSAYGVAELKNKKIKSIVEKPKKPISDLAVIGLYMYDNLVFKMIEKLSPSKRNELEITDVNNNYLKTGDLTFNVLKGFWGDCGESFDSLVDSSLMVKKSHLAQINEKLNIKK